MNLRFSVAQNVSLSAKLGRAAKKLFPKCLPSENTYKLPNIYFLFFVFVCVMGEGGPYFCLTLPSDNKIGA